MSSSETDITQVVGPPHALEPRSEPGSSRLLEPGEQVGRYLIRKRLAAGGMGEVYLAHDPELDRPVALKLLRPELLERGAGPSQGRARLLREAQAMARLSHLNVVTVHDVGVEGRHVFIAMEYVEGVTLREWLLEQVRSWREVVRVFVRAGRGLAAAHAAGLVHRDFKPSNVMVGRDGRVCVLDFGLARPAGGPLPAEAPAPVPAEGLPAEGAGVELPRHSLLDTPLTQEGRVPGTTGYMSPEQLAGQGADARSDQFSFCVALYEALYGQRPFPGHTFEEYRRQVREGAPQAQPRGTKVPAWLHVRVLRGLALEPDKRFASMAELLGVLAHDRQAVRLRRLQVGAGVVGVLGLVAWGLWGSVAPAPCQGAERKLTGVWDGERKAAMQRAFSATGQPFAEAAWRGVQQELEAYAQGWVAQHTEACEATRVRGEQGEQVLTLRMLCLGRRLESLRALGEVFVQADAAVVERALGAAQGLPPLAQCADLERLSRRELLPEAPQVRVQVLELEAKLARARALFEAGRYKPSLAEAAAVAEPASALGHAPLEAEVWLLLARIRYVQGEPQSAAWSADRAVRAALSSQQPELQVQAWLLLLRGLSSSRSHAPEELDRLVGYARSALVAAGEPPGLVFELEDSLAILYRNLGAPARAVEHARRALALAESHHGPEHLHVAEALHQLGGAYLDLAQPAQAVEAMRRSLELRQRLLGPEHPQTAVGLSAQALSLASSGRAEEALALEQQALALYELLLPGSAAHAQALDNLAAFHLQLGQVAEAEVVAERALALSGWREGSQEPMEPAFLYRLAQCRQRLGRRAQAQVLARQALERAEQLYGPRHAWLGPYLNLVAELELAQGQQAQATALLERALGLLRAGYDVPQDAGRTRLLLAQALWPRSPERPRALTLLAQARADLERAGPVARRDLDAWHAWVQAHTPDTGGLQDASR